MTGALERVLAAAAVLALSACGVSPERDPQPLPAPSPSAVGAVDGRAATAGGGHPWTRSWARMVG